MPKVILVVGLPGSGKSALCRELAAGGPGPFNDFLGVGFIHKDRGLGSMIWQLQRGEDCVGNDVQLCDPAMRAKIEAILRSLVPGLIIEWRFFANDPVQCLKNVVHDYIADAAEHRHNLRNRVNGIDSLTRVYTIPDGATPRPVYRPPFGDGW